MIFLSVPKCHRARTTFNLSKVNIPSETLYNADPNNAKFPCGTSINVSFAKIKKSVNNLDKEV